MISAAFTYLCLFDDTNSLNDPMKFWTIIYFALVGIGQHIGMISENPMLLIPLVLYFLRKH